MGNGTSAGQGNYTTYGSRDVERATEQATGHWPPELARPTQTSTVLLAIY